MAGDHHRGLVAFDPLHQFDIAEEALATPACRRIRRWGVVRPDPSLRPSRASFAQLGVDALFHQRSVPPWADREQRVADHEIVAIAGDAEFADLADPARDLLALRTSFIEIVVARAEDDAGEAGEQREILLHHHDLG